MKCAACSDNVYEDDTLYGEPATLYAGKPLCENCYYDGEADAIVLYGKDPTPYEITLARNATGGKFRVKWCATDPYRGYFETESDEYALVNDAVLLAHHKSQEMMRDFDHRVQDLFNENDIDYARVFARSSNVMASSYDLYVKKEQETQARRLVDQAKGDVDYRNPKWYTNIVMDEESLGKLARLFPEERIQNDYDVVKLVEKYGESVAEELEKRIKGKEAVS